MASRAFAGCVAGSRSVVPCLEATERGGKNGLEYN
jgi:hypothetical protein